MFYGAVGRVGVRGLVGGFSPASLFAAGEQGVWYDPSDFSTMFQNISGTTPVTAVEQPVALLLDKSKGLVIGPEIVTNGDFSSGTTGWSGINSGAISNPSGALIVTYGGSANPGAQGSGAVVVGAWYLVSFTVTAITGGGTIGLYVGSTDAGGTTYRTTPGTTTAYLRATSTASVQVLGFGNTGSFTIDNVSVKLVSGNHASQSTDASRPVLSARVNQLLATATLSTQNVTTLAATYTLSFSGAGTVTATGTNIGVYSAGSNSLVCTAGTLTLTVVGSVTSADLRVTNDGVGLPAYQAVVTSTNYDTSGFPLYLRFDGTDDSLATATITPGTDKVQIFAGVRKLSDAARGIVMELNSGAGTTGVFSLNAPDAATATYSARSTGTVFAGATSPTSYFAPITNVITGLGDISGDTVTLRVNATQVAQTTTDQGTGNYLAYPIYIGRRGGAAIFFNGNLYSLIVRFGSNLDATTISNTETYVNSKTLAY